MNENRKRKERKAYDKRRTNVQRGAAAEGNREMQSDDDGLCDDGGGGATATDEGQRAVPQTEGAQDPISQRRHVDAYAGIHRFWLAALPLLLILYAAGGEEGTRVSCVDEGWRGVCDINPRTASVSD